MQEHQRVFFLFLVLGFGGLVGVGGCFCLTVPLAGSGMLLALRQCHGFPEKKTSNHY